MEEKVFLKKYANRRLYDTEKSSYVILDEVADVIRQGRQVEVVDAKTGEDVTAFVLTQIVLEEARKKNVLLPVPLLHLFIQYGQNVLEEFFEKYLEQTINGYLTYKSTVDAQFKRWLDLGMDISGMTQKMMTGIPPFQTLFGQSGGSEAQEHNEEKAR
jgi:polyhydroxyalkanoate synthesis repressor PhaR